MSSVPFQEWNPNLVSLRSHSYGGYIYPHLSLYDQYQNHDSNDNDLRTRVAISTIENIKHEIEEDSASSTKRSECGSIDSGQRYFPTDSATPKSQTQLPSKTVTPTVQQERETKHTHWFSTEGETPGKGTWNRQGRVIYKMHSGLLPNYTGYIPGQKFIYGKTWGVSTANALHTKDQVPFQWTSLF